MTTPEEDQPPHPVATGSSTRWLPTSISLALVLLVFAVYSQTFRFEFVNFDDNVFVTENPHILKGLTWANAAWAMTAGIGKDSVDIDWWRPVSVMSHMLDVSLFGLNAGAHHAVNVVLHALTTVLLFLVVRAMTGATWRSAFVAAVFAIHPLHVESVAWVAERKDILCGLFFTLTLGAYLRFTQKPFSITNYLWVVLLFALGLMSKPMIVTLPCVLLLLDFWPLNRQKSTSLARLITEKIPLLAMSATAAFLTTLGPGGTNDEMMAKLSGSWRMANALTAYAIYLRQTVWPTGLACLYPHPGRNLTPATIYISIATLTAISLAVILLRNRRYLVVGWLWFLGMLVPVIGIVQSGVQAHADRYTYLAQCGLIFAATWMLADWAGNRQPRRTAAGTLAALVLVALSLVAYRQTACWQNNETLWTQTLRSTHHNTIAHYNLGTYLVNHGRLAEGTYHLEEVLKIDPTDDDAYANIGFALLKAEKPAEATIPYRKAVAINPNNIDVLYNLGGALSALGLTDEAMIHLERAIKIRPSHADAHLTYGNCLLAKGRLAEAINQFNQAIRINPNQADAHNSLGSALLRQSHEKEGIAEITRALQIKPDYPDAHNNLGFVMLQQGRTDEALAHFHEALKSDPTHVLAINNLAGVMLQRGEIQEAITQLKIALKKDPNHQPCRIKLATALLKQGKIEDAILQFQILLEANPNHVEALYMLGNALFQNRQYHEAIKLMQKASDLQSNNPSIQNDLAWILAVTPDPTHRDGAKAVRLATSASKSLPNNPQILETLAAAQAEGGDFPNALKTARQALELAKTQRNEPLAEALLKEIQHYVAKRPYHLAP